MFIQTHEEWKARKSRNCALEKRRRKRSCESSDASTHFNSNLTSPCPLINDVTMWTFRPTRVTFYPSCKHAANITPLTQRTRIRSKRVRFSSTRKSFSFSQSKEECKYCCWIEQHKITGMEIVLCSYLYWQQAWYNLAFQKRTVLYTGCLNNFVCIKHSLFSF